MSPFLEVSGLSVAFPGSGAPVRAANDVGFEVRDGEILGIVGESGSGKSVLLRALIGLVPPPGSVTAGSVKLEGRELLGLTNREWDDVRGATVGLVLQDAMSSLNPVRTIGDQLTETLRQKRGISKDDAAGLARDLLNRVGLSGSREGLARYSHQLSGGMRQRVMIALAVAGEPRLLLADEPTTALDVSVQDQILSLLLNLQNELEMSMVFVSHDLDVIGQICDRVGVMYAGRLLEFGSTKEVLEHPRHPYTEALLKSVPRLTTDARESLSAIEGQPPELDALPPGCPFAPRCRHAVDACLKAPMGLDRPIPAHGTACIRWGDQVAA